MQTTLVLIKPDALARGLAGQILSRFEAALLRIEQCRLCRPNLRQLESHYADLKARDARAFRRTTSSLQNQPFLALLLAGPNAIDKVRAIVGGTEPLRAAPGTIRGDFGNDSFACADAEERATANLVHASDCPASVARESAIWFGRGEIALDIGEDGTD